MKLLLSPSLSSALATGALTSVSTSSKYHQRLNFLCPKRIFQRTASSTRSFCAGRQNLFSTKLRLLSAFDSKYFSTSISRSSQDEGYDSYNESAAKTNDEVSIDPKLSVCSRMGLEPLRNRFHHPIVNHENYSFDDWPPNHTFPMDKFARLAQALTTTCKKNTPSSRLPRPLVRLHEDFFRPLDMEDAPLYQWFAEPSGPLESKFLSRVLNGRLTKEECRYIGFREQMYRPELIRRTVLEVLGTMLSCQLAYQYGLSSNVAGGTHHARRDKGAGYTILNDLAIAANFITDEKLNKKTILGVERVLVIDTDVHQGDGTASFSALHDQNRLFTLSLHCADNYPQLKATSTYDVGLPAGCDDDEYMKALQKSVCQAISETKPQFVLYDAGVDVYANDKLGRLKMTENGIHQRDRYVIDKCVGEGIPVVAVVGGGYDKDVNALARRHAIVHEECAFVWRKYKMWERH